MAKYLMVHHFDVWGNAKDGWEVNDSCRIREVELSDEWTNEELLKKLKDVNMIRKHVRLNMMNIDDSSENILINIRRGDKPFLTLEMIA